MKCLGSKEDQSRRSNWMFQMFDILLRFETRFHRMRLTLKIDAKFCIFDPPPPVKFREEVGEMNFTSSAWDRTSGTHCTFNRVSVGLLGDKSIGVKNKGRS